MRRLHSLHGLYRVLDQRAVRNLDEYIEGGGGQALTKAREIGADQVIGTLTEAGLRGRGGGGFPAGVKWRTVADSSSPDHATSVVVNAAEGEPGTFKDRAIIRRNPYRVLEGALVAAHTVGASAITLGVKATFNREIARLDHAISEINAAGWADGVDIEIVLGAGYLFGEETALLEVIEGRQPFPRIAPPFRRGIDDDDPTRSAANIDLAELGGSDEPPALASNVETYANVPLILTNGSSWFREFGTTKSPGTIVVTVSGDTNRAGIAEIPLGTTLRDAIELVGWGVKGGREVGVVLSGVANALIPPEGLDTPLTYEDMAAAGYGLGSAGFIVFDDTVDAVAVTQGVSHFLAVESCGQCEGCKADGEALSILLELMSRSEADSAQLDEIRRRTETVAIGARCNLARQQEAVVKSLLSTFPSSVNVHISKERSTAPAAPVPIPLIAPIVDIVAGTATLDEKQSSKQFDWSYGDSDSGTWPAARFGDTPFLITEPFDYERETSWAMGDDTGRMHPLAQMDAVHNQIDDELHTLLHGPAELYLAARANLVHTIAVHSDVTERVLYPTVRRHCGAKGDDLVDAASGTLAELVEAAERIPVALPLTDDTGDAPTQHGQVATAVHLVAKALHDHTASTEMLFNELRTALDEQEKKILMDALAEAATYEPD